MKIIYINPTPSYYSMYKESDPLDIMKQKYGTSLFRSWSYVNLIFFTIEAGYYDN